MCFSPKKHKLLVQVSESQSPIKISKLSSNINNNDVIVNQNSNVTLLKDAPFLPDDRFKKDSVLSLNDLLNLAQGQIVAVKAHVTRLYSETTHKTRSGEEIPRQEVIISDSTNSIKLVLYDQDVNTLTEGKSYILKNVRLYTFKDKVYVNSTAERKFDFEEIDTISDPIDVNVGTEVKMLCKIVGVASIHLTRFCVSCTKKLNIVDFDKTIDCNHCHGTMLVDSCRVTISFTLILNDIDKNKNIQLYFPSDKCGQLRKIIDFSLEDDKCIAKALLEFPNIFEIFFDIVSNTVLDVSKV